jgi:SanA protein
MLATTLTVGLFIFQIDKNITMNAGGKIFDTASVIPENKTGLLLGTSKRVVGGRINLFYKARLDAAEELYKLGKIKTILISGDNSTKYYSEPQDMKEDLIRRGIPENKIFLDYAGFRTLDSIIRAKKIFDLNKYTIITQKFHCERALYIAQKQNHQAICFRAKDVQGVFGRKVIAREKLARVKAWIDLNILHKQPKFLGEKIQIL